MSWVTADDSEADQHCEQMWEENRETAEGPYMDRDRYIANCHENDRFWAENGDLFND